MVRHNKKSGFSLAEALVSMLILSIFFAATAKVISTKPKDEKIVAPHGYFECYYNSSDNNKLYMHAMSGNGTTISNEAVTGDKCKFTPNSGASFMNITVIYPNRVGGFQEIQPFISNELYIKPSKTLDDITTIESDDEESLIFQKIPPQSAEACENDENRINCNMDYTNINSYLKSSNSQSYTYGRGIGFDENPGGVMISW